MKILAISNFTGVKNTNTQNNTLKTASSVNSYSSDVFNSTNLVGYEASKNLLIRPQISFSGSGNDLKHQSKKTEELMKELESYKAELQALEGEKDSEEVKKAKYELKFCSDFEAERDDLEKVAREAATRERDRVYDDLSWWGKLWSDEPGDAYYKVFTDSEYYRKNTKYNDYSWRKETNEAIVKGANKTDEERQKRIKELKELIKSKNEFISYTSIIYLIDEYMNGAAGLNTSLAGYDDVKQEIQQFIGQLMHGSRNIPSCVLLYGAIGTGKTTFLKCVEDTAKDNVVVKRFVMSSSSNNDFMDSFHEYMEDAKNTYKQTGKRTVLLIDEAEAYFAKSIESAMQNPEDYDADDMAKLKNINSSRTNEYASQFKHILDSLSKEPSERDQNNSAMTIFITTNYPHLMHDDLIFREGKVHAFHVGPADGHNLAEVVKFYFKQNNQTLNIIKLLKEKSPEIQKESIAHMDNITDKGKEKIYELLQNNSIDKVLNIDTENVDFNKLTHLFRPNSRMGAYTNDQIAHISKRAFRRYLENPSQEYKRFFIDEMLRSKRALNSDRYNHFKAIEKQVNLIANRPESGDDQGYLMVQELLISKLSGSEISEADENHLAEFIKLKRPRMDALEDKFQNDNIESEEEALEYERLKVIFDLVDNIDSNYNY